MGWTKGLVLGIPGGLGLLGLGWAGDVEKFGVVGRERSWLGVTGIPEFGNILGKIVQV